MPVLAPSSPGHYEVGMWQVEHRFHSQLPMATVWAHGASQATATTPGPTIEAVRGYPIDVRWSNHLPDRHLLAASVDTSLHMAHPARGIPTVVHLHGAETEPGSDGFPESWFTAEFAEKGPTWEKETYHYENEQRSTLLWYHEHALGFTRLNIYAGLAGLYILRDPANDPRTLPSGRYVIPLILQDRMFHADGSLAYPTTGVNPDHPQWQPEFFGNVICVNGTAWPHLDVEPRRYRFRVVNASGSRFYRLGVATEDPAWSEGPTIRQIGTDGGLLRKAVWIAGGPGRRNHALLVAPAERADVIVDFTGLPVGSRFVLTNDAATPFPGGDPVDSASTGRVMEFRIVTLTANDRSSVPEVLDRDVFSVDERVARVRTLTLNEIEGDGGPEMSILNGQMWDSPISEVPQLGTTELWQIVNITDDVHPIHLHNVQFRLLNRQAIDEAAYEAAFDRANPSIPADVIHAVAPEPFLRGATRQPDDNEDGRKDTFHAEPGMVNRILVHFGPSDGTPSYPYDATAAPGYVWHCHISEHEDNEMMRPYQLVGATVAKRASVAATSEGALLSLHEAGAPRAVTLTVSRLAMVDLDVLDVSGRRLRELLRRALPPGTCGYAWDGLDESGRKVPRGVYFVRAHSRMESATLKLVLAP